MLEDVASSPIGGSLAHRTGAAGDGWGEHTLYEAQQWLTAHPDGFLADRFAGDESALHFVARLYRAGAERVEVYSRNNAAWMNVMRVTLPTDGKRQDSERKRAMARVILWWPRLDDAYAACSTAYTSPHRSWNRRRCSDMDTVSFRCWRERRWSRSSSWAEQKRAAASNEPKPRIG